MAFSFALIAPTIDISFGTSAAVGAQEVNNVIDAIYDERLNRFVDENGNFDGQIVYHRIEKLAFKDRGTYFDGTGLYKLLDDWSLHVKHRSVCVKYIEGSALSIQKWKK